MVEEGLGERSIYLCMCAGGITQKLPRKGPICLGCSPLPLLISLQSLGTKKEAGLPASQPPTAV